MKELLKKKTVKIGLLIIVLLMAAVIIGINVQSARRQKEYDNHIKAAEKYLTELDYEQAIAEYTLAYEIEPSEEVLDALEQTYLVYAQSYVDAGDYESAISILEEGYAQIGRDSLRERIEELRAEMEAGVQRQSEDKADELWQVVHSEEFMQNLYLLINLSSRLGHNQYITDEQLKEKSRPFIESLEQYKELYQEDHRYDSELLDLYMMSEEYETCIEFKQQLDESGSDWDSYVSEHMRDEYGRIYWYNNKEIVEGTMNSGDGLQEVTREFDNNERLIKLTVKNEGMSYPGEQNEIIWLYEYDAEGRLIQTTSSCYAPIVGGHNGNYEIVTTYEYDRAGFTEYETATMYSDIDHGTIISYSGHSRDFVVDEYGKVTYGEFYDEFFENL